MGCKQVQESSNNHGLFSLKHGFVLCFFTYRWSNGLITKNLSLHPKESFDLLQTKRKTGVQTKQGTSPSNGKKGKVKWPIGVVVGVKERVGWGWNDEKIATINRGLGVGNVGWWYWESNEEQFSNLEWIQKAFNICQLHPTETTIKKRNVLIILCLSLKFHYLWAVNEEEGKEESSALPQQSTLYKFQSTTVFISSHIHPNQIARGKKGKEISNCIITVFLIWTGM